MDRRIPIVITVVGFHALGLWALQAGLLHRAVELVVPVSVMTDFIEPAPPRVTPAPPPPVPRPTPSPKTTTHQQPVTRPVPLPVAAPESVVAPSPPTPVSVAAPAPATHLAQTAQEPVAATALLAPPAPPSIELPSRHADYLNNPPPPYPPLSKRMGEQGKVVIRAFIDSRGVATQAEVHASSGYARLDQAALQTVLKWRYVPGKRAGVAEGMWFNVPIQFVLE